MKNCVDNLCRATCEDFSLRRNDKTVRKIGVKIYFMRLFTSNT